MYNILSADFIVVCDKQYQIIPNGAIVFDKRIIEVDTIENIQSKYSAKIEYLGSNSVLMPGLINAHTHLEFSANTTTLKYGNFVKWLFSVIKHREELIQRSTKKLIDDKLTQMLHNGTTTIGAISSYGFDMPSCVDTPINVVYFNEALGSQPQMIDTLFADFKARFKNSLKYKKDNFIPAIAIHSPYSTHPFLIREVLKIAKEYNVAVSAHFLESKAENDWLKYSNGEFEEFFHNMLNQTKSLTTAEEFLKQFQGISPLSFTHCVEANQAELNQIKSLNASIIHCPVSNRLLTNSTLNLSYLNDIKMAMGTDGLSSNHSLNMFDELRNGFFIHTNFQLEELAQKLLISATSGGADALGLKKGILQKGYDRDIIGFRLPDKVEISNLFTAIILHTTSIDKIYISGEKI